MKTLLFSCLFVFTDCNMNKLANYLYNNGFNYHHSNTIKIFFDEKIEKTNSAYPMIGKNYQFGETNFSIVEKGYLGSGKVVKVNKLNCIDTNSFSLDCVYADESSYFSSFSLYYKIQDSSLVFYDYKVWMSADRD